MVPKLISPKKARARGLTWYFTGKPCMYGHVAPRWLVNNGCCTCNQLNRHKYRLRRKDEIKEKVMSEPERTTDRKYADAQKIVEVNELFSKHLQKMETTKPNEKRCEYKDKFSDYKIAELTGLNSHQIASLRLRLNYGTLTTSHKVGSSKAQEKFNKLESQFDTLTSQVLELTTLHTNLQDRFNNLSQRYDVLVHNLNRKGNLLDSTLPLQMKDTLDKILRK